MRRLLAVGAVIGVFCVGTSSASAAPGSVVAPKQLCTQQGGAFFPFPDFYTCEFGPPGAPMGDELHVARTLCEKGYKGTFIRFPGGQRYICVFPEAA